MGIKLYDEAIIRKINTWIHDPNLKVLKPNESNRLFSIKADENKDKPLTLPLISVSRDPSIGLDITGRRALSCDGTKMVSDENEDVTYTLDAVPINISYQIDIYTKKYEEGDDYIRAFILNLINYPRMLVEIPYNGLHIQHTCYLKLQNEITDNSDIAEKLYADELTRWTIRVTVNDAFLFGVPKKVNARIKGVELEVDSKGAEDGAEDKTIYIVYDPDHEEDMLNS